MKYYQVGGQETVTNVLAHKFIEEGHNVSVVCFTELSPIMLERADKQIHFYGLGDFKASKKNITSLREILINEKINIIINQWGLPYIPTKVASEASRSLNIKYISVYHNDPGTNGRLKVIEQQLHKEQSAIKRGVLKVKWQIVRIMTGISMNYVYRHSDFYALLSKSFIESFRKFAFLKNVSKVKVIANPLTIDFSDTDDLKQREILFVGRLENNQKRVDRILDIWALLYRKYPNWKLTIVGDGEDRDMLEEKSRKLQLKNIEFAGYHNPVEYFKRASILLLTSDYEGFGLVIIEGMIYGVVPVVYGSYSAVYDIIDDTVDGLIISKDTESVIPVKMAEKIEMLIDSPVLLNQMSIRAIEKSKNYSLDKIYLAWMSMLFNRH
ncbi:hypothetical protein FACS189440_11900 [Bacteroidia bacterium]|nr:hypothetical protein FACS189440_11900 [Bacteroidia bacterium]